MSNIIIYNDAGHHSANKNLIALNPKKDHMIENNLNITTLHDLLDFDARKFIIAEVQLKKVLPEWINTAGSLKLKNVLQKYLAFVEEHVKKMEDFIEEESITSLSLTNRIMKAFIDDAAEKLRLCADIAIKDACLLATVQSINHFKISAYGTAAAFAQALQMEKNAQIFHEAEVNEKQIDDRLSQLAEHEVNANARTPFVLPK